MACYLLYTALNLQILSMPWSFWAETGTIEWFFWWLNQDYIPYVKDCEKRFYSIPKKFYSIPFHARCAKPDRTQEEPLTARVSTSALKSLGACRVHEGRKQHPQKNQ